MTQYIFIIIIGCFVTFTSIWGLSYLLATSEQLNVKHKHTIFIVGIFNIGFTAALFSLLYITIQENHKFKKDFNCPELEKVENVYKIK